MRIAVVGAGYVGLSLATLLSTRHEVRAVDVAPHVVQKINARISPLKDALIEEYFATKELQLQGTTELEASVQWCDVAVLALPTSFDTETKHFDTSALDSVCATIARLNPDLTTVIKSTLPIGYTAGLVREHGLRNLLFSPEFLREGRALEDNLYPSRIIVGTVTEDGATSQHAKTFAALLRECALNDPPVFEMTSTEAESVKLFSNTYLAMRVAYFNELDTYCEQYGLDTQTVIDGVSGDPRIGNYHNNPSFGYGGYCLPKDSKQLLAEFGSIPQTLISATVSANNTRKHYIFENIKKRVAGNPDAVVGIYRLVAKSGSDNFRSAVILDVMELLAAAGIKMVVFEPSLHNADTLEFGEVEADLEAFKERSTLIVANRYDASLADVTHKLYTRDTYHRD